MKKRAKTTKSVSSKSAKPPQITASDLEEFQAAYGNDWIQIIKTPAFRSAMQLLNVQKMESITNLPNEQIEKNGREILADLRGHLQHENNLLILHEKRDTKLPWEEQEEYFSPE